MGGKLSLGFTDVAKKHNAVIPTVSTEAVGRSTRGTTAWLPGQWNEHEIWEVLLRESSLVHKFREGYIAPRHRVAHKWELLREIQQFNELNDTQ